MLLRAVLELFAGTPNIASTFSNWVAASLSCTTSAGEAFSKADSTEGDDNTGDRRQLELPAALTHEFCYPTRAVAS